MGLQRLVLRRTDLRGLVMGFAGYDEAATRDAVVALARALT